MTLLENYYELYGRDLVAMAHASEFIDEYLDFVTEWFGYDPQLERYDSRHLELVENFFADIGFDPTI